ncbi:hypothetical protein [Ferrimonas balearica]|uniref:hypothetical protein n=1 Tax=Ferrimonas balearica TaxID=44012 RepID=UPI001C99B2C1|nr:hypothetical protein [Ferrimonas balearica]MBY5992640.1 hypothetical protein [Ferrimonas balearica]
MTNEMLFSYGLGTLLSLWVLWDLFTGRVYLWQAHERKQEPGTYWFAMALWSALAISCFTYPYWSLS